MRDVHGPAAIEVAGLRVAYGKHVVLDGIDLQVPEGTVYALLGPNGAGKSTLVHVLATLLRPDAGEVRVAGHDLRDDPAGVRAAIGLTGQISAVDALLTGRENLRLMADLAHLGRAGATVVDGLIERFDLGAAAGKPAGTYSGGMRRRLDLAMTLVGNPQVLFLDEPTTGLDPRSRRDVWDVVTGLVDDGTTVLLTTQYLEEADQLADRVGVLDGGHLVAEGSAAELKRRVGGGQLLLRVPDLAALAGAVAAVGATVHHGDERSTDLTVAVAWDGSPDQVRDVLERLAAHGVAVDELAIHAPDLDDVFLALTGGVAAGVPA
ncbi:ATP-binding cassette domain-containing protein [Pseudonocardia sp. CA-107938]|uniref:ATP-binding cassette domain-containing protein n=1 Tax=Pseudonocardia sp. CA-107938 TaxID=3240021 RepID=UPI003D8A1820